MIPTPQNPADPAEVDAYVNDLSIRGYIDNPAALVARLGGYEHVATRIIEGAKARDAKGGFPRFRKDGCTFP